MSFDMIHHGHIRLLKRAKALGDELVVSLLSDESYELYRGYPPVMPYKERYSVISSLSAVNRVIEGDNRNTVGELNDIKPQIVVVGSDWAKKYIYKQYNLTPEWFDKHDIVLLFLPYTKGISSTELRKRACGK